MVLAAAQQVLQGVLAPVPAELLIIGKQHYYFSHFVFTFIALLKSTKFSQAIRDSFANLADLQFDP